MEPPFRLGEGLFPGAGPQASLADGRTEPIQAAEALSSTPCAAYLHLQRGNGFPKVPPGRQGAVKALGGSVALCYTRVRTQEDAP